MNHIPVVTMMFALEGGEFPPAAADIRPVCEPPPPLAEVVPTVLLLLSIASLSDKTE